MGQDYLTGNGADFAMVFKLEKKFVEPMKEAKQMTAAQAAGAASHTMVFFLHHRLSWPQTSIEKVLFDVE
jgi:hypothetical protein